MNLPKRNIFTIGEAASKLGVSISTLRRWEREGKISVGRTLGGKRAFTQEDLDRLSSPIKTEVKVQTSSFLFSITPTKILIVFLLFASIATNAFFLFSYSPAPKNR